MRVLIACEFSGIVRDAFSSRGHDAWSCDLLASERASERHFQCDVREVWGKQWDLMIAHPPCTYLCVSGNRWMKQPKRQWQQQEALAFAKALGECWLIEKTCVENPIGRLSTLWRKPDQIIQPWQFGHEEKKATCLWLKGLPKLKPTKIVLPLEARVHECQPGPDRWKERSRTMQGIAEAMASQWG